MGDHLAGRSGEREGAAESAREPTSARRTLEEENAGLRAELSALRGRRTPPTAAPERTGRLAQLHAFTAALAGARTAADVAEAVFQKGLAAVGASGATLRWEVEPGRLQLLHQTGMGGPAAGISRDVGADEPVPLAEALRTGQAIWLGSPEDLRERFPRVDWRSAQLGGAAWAVLPLFVEGKAVGTLLLAFPLAQRFDDDERAFLGTIAEQCAQALDRARLYEEALREIAARRHAEEALRESEATLRGILDATQESIWLFEDDRILLANQTALARFRKPAAEVLGKRLHEVQAPHLAQARLARIREALAAGRALEFEDERDGISFHHSFYPVFDAAGRATRVACFSRDVTEQRQAAAALAQRTEELDAARAEAQSQASKLEAVMDALPVGVSILDTEGGSLRYNRAFEQIWGGPTPSTRSVDDFVAYRAWWVESGLPVAPEEWAAARAVQTGEPVVGQLLEIERFDGERRFVINSGAPIHDAEGKVIGCAVAIQDVTDLKRAEEALREADQRKDEFLAVLSHELRNPLAPIGNSLQVLAQAAPGSPPSTRAQAVIERQTRHLTRLVDDLLDVTRISRGKIRLHRVRVELNDLALQAAEDHRSLFENSGIALDLYPCPRPLVLAADQARVTQVIGNLLQNAAKFTGAGGRTSLLVEEDASRAQAVLRVRDTGAGMRAETLARLFLPFVQADATLDRSRGGLGLGLSLVKGLVELHGGTVAASSEGPEQGSELVVRLPLAAPTETRAASAPPERPSGGRRVLVIDDNFDAADSLRDVLELSGHTVAVAHDGPEGIELARVFRPEVVFCDIGLPGMNGYAVARAMRADEALACAQVVALSGYALPEDVARGKEAGFDAHIAKPPRMEEIERHLATPAGVC